MDAAAAAAMSDPDSNRWFRRRWQEPQPPAERLPPAAACDQNPVEQTGRALLEEWRRELAQRVGRRP